MKFVSKSNNLRIVLRPGIPGSAVAGREPISGIYVKFQDGMAIVNDSEQIEMMLKHPGFDRDFIIVDEIKKDPYAYQRQESEPGHIIQEIKYGHAESRVSSSKNPPLTPQMNRFIDDLVNARIKEMLPGVLEATIKGISQVHKEKKQIEDVGSEEKSNNSDENELIEQGEDKKGKRGRPPGKKNVEQVVE